MRTQIPITNPLLIADATAGMKGMKILNTGAVAVYVSQNKPILAQSVNPNTNVPTQGWILNPNDRLEYSRIANVEYFAVAAGAGGEIEVDLYDVELPCCP